MSLPSLPVRLQRAGIGDDVASGIDDERVIAVGEDRPLKLHPKLHSYFSH
jgi:hypothetical protein